MILSTIHSAVVVHCTMGWSVVQLFLKIDLLRLVQVAFLIRWKDLQISWKKIISFPRASTLKSEIFAYQISYNWQMGAFLPMLPEQLVTIINGYFDLSNKSSPNIFLIISPNSTYAPGLSKKQQNFFIRLKIHQKCTFLVIHWLL